MSKFFRKIREAIAQDKKRPPRPEPPLAEAWGDRDMFDKEIQGKGVRIMWKDHPQNLIVLQELPSKPLKRHLRRLLVSTESMLRSSQRDPWSSNYLLGNVLRDTKFSKGMTFDKAVAALRNGLTVTKQRALKDGMDPSSWQAEEADRLINTKHGVVYFLEVEPEDYQPVKLKGEGWTGTVEWGRFRISDLRRIDQDDPSGSTLDSQSKGGARKFFKLAKADPDQFRRLSLSQMTDWFKKNGIGYKWLHSVWR